MQGIHDRVQLVLWREAWAHDFELEKQAIMNTLTQNGHTAEVLHIGSSSVEGMISKPIMDILVCPDKKIPPEALLPDLESIGYHNLGECGRHGRCFLTRGDEPGRTFYVHLCHKSNPVAQDQLLFQQLERSIPTVFSGYYALKTKLAALFPENRMLYREWKGIYIAGVLSAYRAGEKSVKEQIRAELIRNDDA